MSAPPLQSPNARVVILNHPWIENDLVAGYDVLARDWLPHAANSTDDRGVSASAAQRSRQWQAQVLPILKALEARDRRDVSLAMGAILVLPFTAALGVTFLVSVGRTVLLFVFGLAPLIPPLAIFLAQYFLWLAGTIYLAWHWVELGAKPLRPFRVNLPPKPNPGQLPARECQSPEEIFLERISQPFEKWAHHIAFYGVVWPVTNGQPGELSVLTAVRSAFDQTPADTNTWFVLHGLKLGQRSDADVIVLAPFGVRVLEAKHWQGEIRYQDGRWVHIKHFYAPGGWPDSQERIERDPVEQVRRQLNTLRRVLPGHPAPGWLQGAVVFTHPDSWLEHGPLPDDVAVRMLSDLGSWLGRGRDQALFSTRQLLVMAARLIRHDARFNPYRFGSERIALDEHMRLAIDRWHKDDLLFRQQAEAYHQETEALLASFTKAEQDWQALRSALG